MQRLRGRAWERWQAAAGPWRGWVACHVLAAPDIDGVTPTDVRVSPVVDALVEKVASSLKGGTAVVLDLQPVLGVLIAARLNAKHNAHAVLVLPRWAYCDAVLPVDTLLWTLITTASSLNPHVESTNVVFVLDAERSKPVARRNSDCRADNRYTLSLADLPNLANLRVRGIQRVVKILSA